MTRDELDALIRNTYPTANKLELETIALALGVTVKSLKSQASRMGVKRDVTASRAMRSVSASEVAERRRQDIDAIRSADTESDRRYWRACLAEGGFVRAERIGDQTVWVWP